MIAIIIATINAISWGLRLPASNEAGINMSSCQCTAGIGCSLQNVCIEAVSESQHGYPLQLHYWGDISKLPPSVRTVNDRVYTLKGKRKPVMQVVQGKRLDDPYDWVFTKREKPAVFLDLLGGENYGHHMLDLWYPIFANVHRDNPTSTDLKGAIHVLNKNCTEYPFGTIPFSVLERDPHAKTTCERLYSKFAAHLELGETISMQQTKGVCFKDLKIPETRFRDIHDFPENENIKREINNYHTAMVKGSQKKGEGTLILVKEKLAKYDKFLRGQQPMTMAQAQALSQALQDMECNHGRTVEVKRMPTNLSMMEEVEMYTRFSHFVFPGGGAGFAKYIVPSNTTSFVCALRNEETRGAFKHGNFTLTRSIAPFATRPNFDAKKILRVMKPYYC